MANEQASAGGGIASDSAMQTGTLGNAAEFVEQPRARFASTCAFAIVDLCDVLRRRPSGPWAMEIAAEHFEPAVLQTFVERIHQLALATAYAAGDAAADLARLQSEILPPVVVGESESEARHG